MHAVNASTQWQKTELVDGYHFCEDLRVGEERSHRESTSLNEASVALAVLAASSCVEPTFLLHFQVHPKFLPYRLHLFYVANNHHIVLIPYSSSITLQRTQRYCNRPNASTIRNDGVRLSRGEETHRRRSEVAHTLQSDAYQATRQGSLQRL
jgi:hypothetical protein